MANLLINTTVGGNTVITTSNIGTYALTSITSGQVTTALGFTPYNATNPSGYISSYTETSTLQNVTSRGNTTTTSISAANFQNAWQVLSLNNIKTPGLYNYDGGITGTQPLGTEWYNVRTIEIGADGRYSQFVMPYHIDRIFYRRKSDAGFDAYVELYHTGNLPTIPTNNNQLTNGAGYISSITSGNVTTALGFTPYNATNPNGYISSSGSISGNANTTSQKAFNDLKIDFPSGGSGGYSFGPNHYSMGLDLGNGAWSHPHYKDLIIGYHTGIRLGASYSGIRFYNNSPTTDTNNDGNGDSGETLLMTIGGYVGTANGTDVVVNNNLIANVSLRAPIFYDSADTSYYLDPNSTSRLYRLQIIGDWSGTTPNDGAINIRGAYPSMTFRNTISGNMWLRHMDGSGDIQHYFAPSGVDANDWSIKHTMFKNGNFYSLGTHTASQFIGSGAGLTGTASSLNVGYATTAGALSSMNISQFTNNSGYITGYTETDTLATVTGRGATTTAAITISKQTVSYGGTFQSFLIDGAGGNAALTINATSDYAYLNFAQAGTTKFEIGAEGAATNKGSLYFNHNIQVGSSGAALYIKKSNGYVGVLNINPSVALDVTGTINATRYTLGGTGAFMEGYGSYSSKLGRVAIISLDWNESYDESVNHGIMSTDSAGNFADSLSINSFNDITLRLDANNNNAESYLRIMNNTSGTNTIAHIGYNGANGVASFSRDLFVNGGTGGNFGNRIVVGADSTPYTLQDTNIRPTVYLTGAYPVLVLNHTVTGNTGHGPTIQFTFNGLSQRQWVIGCGGAGEFMDFGFSNSTYGNTNYSPHNGISGYLGNTIMRIIDNAVGIGGDFGVYGSGGNPAYTLDVRGTIYSNTDMRAPIFYDSQDTTYYLDPNATSNIVASYIGRVLINHDGTDTWFRMQSGNRMRITTTGGTDFIIPNTGEMSYNGNTVLTAANYNSYSPTLTGGNASGTWAINVTGTAARATRANGSFYIDDNYGNTIVGVYASDRYQGVFAMGDSYKLSADGTSSGSLYGIAWTHTNVGGQSKSGLGHQALFMGAGVTQTAIGAGIWTNGLITTTSYGTSANWNTAFGWGNHASAGYLTSLPSHNHDDRYYTETESDARYIQYGSITSTFGLNDNKLYLRTNNDNNHYIWNAADDWEEIVAYSGTGLRIASSTGVTLATFTTSGNSMNITGNAATATSAGYSDYIAAQTNPVGNFNVGLSRPKGASYTTTASVVTGAIKIKLPPGTPVHGMWKMTVKIYEYGQRGNGYTIELGCHLYPSTAHNRYQWMLTTDIGAVLPIRYGTDGSSGCVWIGENGTTWSYPQVHVTEFSNGFNNPGGVNWTSGTWAVSIGAIDNSVAVDGPYTTSLIAAAYATTAGSLTSMNISQFTNNSGYITGISFASVSSKPTTISGYGITDAITTANIGSQSVSYATTAGSAATATTASNLAADTSTRFKILTFTGVGGDSGNGAVPDSYAIYQQGGSWTHPYPDLCIGYHTGIKIGANSVYNGTRFYNDSNWATEIFSVGNGDNHVRVLNNLYVGGNLALHAGNYNSYSPTLTGTGASGTWGISISGNAATATNVAYSGLTGTVPTWNQNTTGSAGSVGGYGVSAGVGANTVVIRQENGYVFFNYINSNVSETENPTINSFYTSNGDGYFRKSSVAHVKSQLGLGSMAYESSGTYQTVSGAINTGNIASQSVSYATISQQLTKFGDIYGQDWNSYFITGKLIVSNALGHTGTNRPSDSYGYGTALSYGETGGPLMQMYFPEDVANSGGAYKALAYRSGYNGGWSAWKTVVNQVGNTCTVAGSNGTGLQVHSNVGYNQNPLTYFLLRGQADSSWKTFKILLTGDAGGQDIEFRRIAENSTDARMFYVPRGANQVIFDYTVVQPSDSRLKDNLTPITTPVEKIKSLRGVEFDWNSGEHVGTHDVGLIAQDVEAVLPEAVTTQEDGYKNLAYTKVIPLLVEAMKEQQTMIEALRAEIELLKNK